MGWAFVYGSCSPHASGDSMKRSVLLPLVYVADQIAGDPEWLPHPVRLMGWAITKGEALARHPEQTDRSELFAGAALTVAVVSASFVLTRMVIVTAYNRSAFMGRLTEVVLGWTCLAGRNLHDEASIVQRALDRNGLVLARSRLARIVGRDTQNLDSHDICRAVIETLAESVSDGVIAPLLYMALGGVPLAMAYKAINTLDSMIGHADARYFYFGKFAARLDDVANCFPSRVTAFALMAASVMEGRANSQAAIRTWIADRRKHRSPNAGQPESAMAGALQVRLGGGNYYTGEFIPAPALGSI